MEQHTFKGNLKYKDMKTIEKIERKGFKVTFAMSGNSVFATKGYQLVKAENITQLYKKIK